MTVQHAIESAVRGIHFRAFPNHVTLLEWVGNAISVRSITGGMKNTRKLNGNGVDFAVQDANSLGEVHLKSLHGIKENDLPRFGLVKHVVVLVAGFLFIFRLVSMFVTDIVFTSKSMDVFYQIKKQKRMSAKVEKDLYLGIGKGAERLLIWLSGVVRDISSGFVKYLREMIGGVRSAVNAADDLKQIITPCVLPSLWTRKKSRPTNNLSPAIVCGIFPTGVLFVGNVIEAF